MALAAIVRSVGRRNALLLAGGAIIAAVQVALWRSRAGEAKGDELQGQPANRDRGRHTRVFKARAGRVYRIPSLVWVPPPAAPGTPRPAGRLLAFAEGRETVADWGRIDLCLRASDDEGRSWSAERALFSAAELGMPGEKLTVGNPTAVFDAVRGRVVLLFIAQLGDDSEARIWARTSRGSRWVFVSDSADAGETWSAPRNITRDVKMPSWTWYATGPGAAIQLTGRATYEDRLVAPCDHVETDEEGSFTLRSHLIYSDDGGASWSLGAIATPFTNECAVAELGDGSLLLNSRDWSGMNQRVLHRSFDGGATFDKESARHDPQLVEPAMHGCQAAMVAHASTRGAGERVLLFSNPASHGRRNLTLRLSSSSGIAWESAVVLHAGPSAYSALAVLGGQGETAAAEPRVACLYECGTSSPYDRISLAVLPLSTLLAPGAGASQAAPPSRASDRDGPWGSDPM